MKDAREKVLKAQAQIADDIDPALVRSEGRNTDTFGALAESYLERYARKFKKSWREDQRLLTRDVLPHWRHLPAKEITRRLVRDIVEKIADRGAPIAANRTLAVISRVFSFAVQRDIVESNPAYHVAKPGVEKSRDRVLSDEELRELWIALGETERLDDEGRHVARLNTTLNDAFRMRILTAQRGGEVFQMRWRDVDLNSGWWEIPADFTKNGEVHRVPLTTLAVAILTARAATARSGAEWVFEHARPSKIKEREFGSVAARGKRLRRSCRREMAIFEIAGHAQDTALQFSPACHSASRATIFVARRRQAWPRPAYGVTTYQRSSITWTAARARRRSTIATSTTPRSVAP